VNIISLIDFNLCLTFEYTLTINPNRVALILLACPVLHRRQVPMSTVSSIADLSSTTDDNLYYGQDGSRGVCIRPRSQDWSFPRRLVSVAGRLIQVQEVESGFDSSIGRGAPEGRRTRLCVPFSVERFSDNCFHDFASLSAITFEPGSNLSLLDNSAFRSCSSLSSIYIPASVTRICDFCFFECQSLGTVTFARRSRLSSLGISAFGECRSLLSISVPSSVTKLSRAAFSGCNSLYLVAFETGCELSCLEPSLFESCDSLSLISIPSAVRMICTKCFNGCGSLSTLTFASGSRLSHVAKDAFPARAVWPIRIPPQLAGVFSEYEIEVKDI
jgi:hypothetical protein